jgi:hypothetical protein
LRGDNYVSASRHKTENYSSTNSGINPGDAIDLEILEDGRIMLISVEAIPKHQLWTWTVESKHLIETSMADPRPSIVVETTGQADDIAQRWMDEG